ncbi:hypothetical protein KUCAC02_037945 [Chaenocephalus aceratus]|nr:hypothetical protein KUCAC02_037945 [Chaenocephalus aceratus]
MWSSPSSSCSSEPGAVLIRSTRVLVPEQRPGSVRISVQKVQDPPLVQKVQEKAARESDSNESLFLKQLPERGDGKLSREAEHHGPQRSSDVKTELFWDLFLIIKVKYKCVYCDKGHDLLTSRFSAGGRGAVLAALRQRSHSAPPRREVRVQLLNTGQPDSQHAPGPSSSQHAVGLGANPLMKTLHSQQLQQQSQLLESALRMFTGHAPLISDPPASGQPTCLQVTHLASAENILSNQQQIPTATTAAASFLETVATATPGHDQQPEQTRPDPRGPPRVHLHSSSNESERAVRRSNETLREMSRLKTQTKTLRRVRLRDRIRVPC